MILIVASELDSVAAEAAANWLGGPATTLTPRDLCTKGWCIETQDFDNGSIVANGVLTPVRHISGVVTRLQCVMDYELFKIEPAERKYAASEINAFLVYFLSRLNCRVLNRPTAYCLSGPSWHPKQWMWACRRAGISAEPNLACSDPLSVAKPERKQEIDRSVSIVGERRLGANSKNSASVAQLAEFARVEFLTAQFAMDGEDEVLRSVSTIPDLRDKAILTAVHEYLMSPQ